MPGNQPFITGVSTKTTIRIVSYKEQVLTGFITNDFYGKTFPFRDVVQMASLLESLFDSLSFPQASMAYRSFKPPMRRKKIGTSKSWKAGVCVDAALNEATKGTDKASFVVHVQFRQNATWQGTITWANKGVTQHFRSVLEMIRLMTEAVEATGETPEIHWAEDDAK